ncbi:MAG: sugar transferase [Candidatus Omnitrophota bacterium]
MKEHEDTIVKERILKRIFDIVVSAFFLLLLSPLFLAFALLLKLEGLINPFFKGPVFFKSIRISRGKEFTMYKFRTVNYDTYLFLEKDKMRRSITEFICSANNKEYLTPVGAFLDKIYFDELPQLYNVLKGDMSMVGPRPHIIEHYNNDIKEGITSAKYIKGGILGLVQASKKNPKMQEVFKRMALKHFSKDKSLEVTERLYFQRYLRASAVELLLFDIWIIYRCLLVVLAAKGI